MEEEKNYLLDKKIEYLVDMKIGKLKAQLEEVSANMKKMMDDVSILKNKVERLNSGVEPQRKLTTDTPPETAGEKEVKKEETNSRTGDFTPGDVSIEKMFYFGNKG
jgi:regulator of replication initiation timing